MTIQTSYSHLLHAINYDTSYHNKAAKIFYHKKPRMETLSLFFHIFIITVTYSFNPLRIIFTPITVFAFT